MKQYLNPDRNKSGFTLIELLVVIAIIGILAALLLAAVSMTKQRALRAQCANNIQQLGVGLQAFLTDNNFYPLFIDPSRGAWAAELQHTELPESGNPAKRINFSQWVNQGVWKCPAAHKPSNLPPHTGYFSYGYNSYGITQPMDTISLGLGGHNIWDPRRNPVATNFPAPPVRESEVVSPSQMMAMGDDFYGGNGVVHDGGLFLGRTSGLQDYDDSTRRSYSRHQGKANVVFCDGHVEMPTLKFLFEETDDSSLVRWNRDHLPHRERL